MALKLLKSILFVVHYTVFQKHVTTFSIIRWSRTVHSQRLFAHLLPTKSISHRQVFSVSYLAYFVQLLYLGKLSRPINIMNLALNCWFC